jgi:hypothetical protein
MRGERRVGGQGEACRAVLKVEPGVLGPAGHNAKRLDSDRLELALGRAHLRDRPSAEGAPQPDEQGEEERTPPAIVGQRHCAVALYRRQSELRGQITRLNRRRPLESSLMGG